jgi:hypothetical protein
MRLNSCFINTIALLLSLNCYAQKSDVLVIGDSQSFGSFGRALHENLNTKHKKRVSYYSRPGSTAIWWLDPSLDSGRWGAWDAPHSSPQLRLKNSTGTPSINSLLSKHMPHLTIVQLGGNMVGLEASEIETQVMALIEKIKSIGSACLWVGPPPGHKRPRDKFPAFYEVLQKAVEKNGCHFIDSRTVVKSELKGGDGIHLDSMVGGPEESRKWASYVARQSERLMFAPENSAIAVNDEHQMKAP